MARARRIAIGTALSVVLLTAGALTTAWLIVTDVFGGRFAVLCTDPEDFACSGHYVHGVANEVWTVAALALGVLGLAVCRHLRRASMPASTA